MWGCGVVRFRVSGFGFRVSGGGFRISDFKFRVSSFGFVFSGAGDVPRVRDNPVARARPELRVPRHHLVVHLQPGFKSTSHDFKSTSNDFKSTFHDFKSTSHDFKSTPRTPRATSSPRNSPASGFWGSGLRVVLLCRPPTHGPPNRGRPLASRFRVLGLGMETGELYKG